MDTKILQRTAAAFAALDCSADNERIAALEDSKGRIATAIATAEARCAELNRTLTEWSGPNAHGVADALLAEVAPSEAVTASPSQEELRDELASLRRAVADLNHRAADTRAAIELIRANAFGRAIDAARPLVDGVIADMTEAAARLVDGFAALEAIQAATRGYRSDAAVHALQGVMGGDRLLPWQREVAVPAEVRHALAPLDGKGSALPVALIDTAHPRWEPTPAAIFMAPARAA